MHIYNLIIKHLRKNKSFNKALRVEEWRDVFIIIVKVMQLFSFLEQIKHLSRYRRTQPNLLNSLGPLINDKAQHR